MENGMSVTVEFFGIPRRRAGVATIELEAVALGELFAQLADRLPSFAQSCLEEGRLQPGYLASINGRTFTRDATTPLRPNDRVLILSADVGG